MNNQTMHEIAISFQTILWVGFVIGMVVHLIGISGMFWFRLARRAPKLDSSDLRGLPGVTMIKPCHGAGDNEEVNFDAYFHQDYPGAYELIFVVSVEDAPVVPIIQRYLAKYPHVDAKLVVSRTNKAFWRKIDAIHDALDVAKHEFILLTDSDTIVQRNYASEMAASLMDPTAGVVTTPQYDCRPNTFASALKVLGNNTDVAAYVMAYALANRNAWTVSGFGQSMGFRKSDWLSFGESAWTTLNRSLSDDQGIPYVFRQHGLRLVYRDISCPVEYSNKTFSQVVSQKIRWLIPQRAAIGNRYLQAAGILCNPTVAASLMMLWTGFCNWSVVMFVATCLFRILITVVFEGLYLRHEPSPAQYFLLVPIWDLMQPYFLSTAFFKDTIDFNGREYYVIDDVFLQAANPADDLQENALKKL